MAPGKKKLLGVLQLIKYHLWQQLAWNNNFLAEIMTPLKNSYKNFFAFLTQCPVR
jgi:hypothetical protein